MVVLNEDIGVLLVALESYVDGVRDEIKEKELKGKAAEIIGEMMERAERLILRLRAQRDNKPKQTALEWNQSLRVHQTETK